MTVKELCDKLQEFIDVGHADTRVIASCNFITPWDCTKGEEVGDFNLLSLDDIVYQSGDIELIFS